MSELRADTITHSDGSSPVTLTKQSAAKAHILFDQRGSFLSGGVATEGSQSFNISSSVDVEEGNYSVAFINNMTNEEYAPVTSAHYNGLVANKNNPRFAGPHTITSSGYIASAVSSNSAAQDALHQSATFGDLA